MRYGHRALHAVLTLLTVMSAAYAHAAPEVLRATLANGLRVVIERNTLAPVATIEVNYLAGSNEAPPGFPGTAHAQEHMMFRGSPGLSADQLSTLIAALGGDFNADTQQTVTQYFFTVPADLLDVALRIESIRMRDVLDSQDLWEKERGAIGQEVAQDLSNPLYVLSSRLLAGLFAGTPYAVDALGTRQSFEKTTGAMLKEFFNAWYAPNNAVLVIVGDVEPKKTLDLVREFFGPIPARTVPGRPEIRLRPLKPAKMISIETDLPYGLAVVAYRLPGFEEIRDFAAGNVLADVLDSKRAKLYGLVPEGKALSAGFDGEALPKSSYGYATVAFPPGGDASGTVSAIKEIIDGYVKTGVPAELVEASKRHEIADAEFRRNSIAGLAAEWSQAIAVEDRATLDDDIEAIKKVTKEDVDRVARAYLNNETALVALLTPKSSGIPSADTAMREKESFSPRETKPVALPDWAKKAAMLPAVDQPGRAPSVSKLPNGLALIVYPTAISRTVSVFGQVKTNPMLQMPEGKEGVAQILESLFPYGTKTLDRLAFQRALDDIGAEESGGANFTLRVSDDRFDRGMELLAANLLAPAFPEPAFRIVRQETANALAGELQSPSYLSSRALRSALYPKEDESLRQATPETVNAISLEDVLSYYRSVFRPDMTTLVIIGNVTPEKARATAEKQFGGWKATGPKPETDLPPTPPNKAATTTVPDASRVQTEVTLAETVGITRTHPDYYALQLGRNVLSGAFYATRLYRDLREESGLVYSVDAILDAGKTRSVFGVAYACDPPNVAKARSLVERDLRAMQAAPATGDELLRAKTLLIRQAVLSRSSTDGIAGEMLHLIADDLPMDEPARAAQRYRMLTAEQVREAFTRWIRVDDFAQVTLGPAPR